MWLSWNYSENKALNIYVLDKTVLNDDYQEHVSLYWVLNNSRYVKPNGELYSPQKDYFGFFPRKDGKYLISGLEYKTEKDLQVLADSYDMVYYTDLYGIYWTEWHNEYPNIKPTERPGKVGERSSLLYGGLTQNELKLLKLIKERKKLIINEFNIIASPTSEKIRKEYEDEFDITWSGWIGRYFDNLDTVTNKELPLWLIRNYKKQNNNNWPFTKSGIAFVRSDDKIVILENQTHLKNEVPVIKTKTNHKDYYSVSDQIKYPFWFDISSSGASNEVISQYHIEANTIGDSILKNWGIPHEFPAVIKSKMDYPYYYFAGDFADNPISMNSSYFKWAHKFDFLFYPSSIYERESFFWLYYRPLITRILEDYHKKVSK